MNARNELYDVRRELRSIINELRNIADGLRQYFAGISSDTCAAKIDAVADQYQGYLNTLNGARIKEPENTIYHGGSGSSGGGGSSRSF